MMPEKEIRKMAYGLQDEIIDLDEKINQCSEYMDMKITLPDQVLVERYRLEMMKEKAMAAQEALWTVLEWKE